MQLPGTPLAIYFALGGAHVEDGTVHERLPDELADCDPQPLPLGTARCIVSLFPPVDRLRPMKPTIRIVTRGHNGELRTKDYEKHETVLKMHTQIGVDDCSTDLSLRGMPVFRGLIGPMPEGKGIVRYESPEVFETLTKEWSVTATSRGRRRSNPAPS
jgi:hypothetical protein